MTSNTLPAINSRCWLDNPLAHRGWHQMVVQLRQLIANKVLIVLEGMCLLTFMPNLC